MRLERRLGYETEERRLSELLWSGLVWSKTFNQLRYVRCGWVQLYFQFLKLIQQCHCISNTIIIIKCLIL